MKINVKGAINAKKEEEKKNEGMKKKRMNE